MMTQATLIAVLAVALVLAMVIILIGILRFARVTDQQTEALSDIEKTISHATVAIRSGFKTVRRKISHSEEMTGQKRRELIQLILDSERRSMDMIRDLGHQLTMQGIRNPSVTVQNSTGSGAANQAGNNEQRR